METNYEHYLGTPERAATTMVVGHSWPFHINVYRLTHSTEQIGSQQLVATLDSVEAYQRWLQSPYDDGTIIWDD